MRFLLSIGVLVLHSATSIAAADRDSIVFPDENESGPVSPVRSPKPFGLAEFGRMALRAATESTNAFSQKFFQEVAKDNSGNMICSPISTSLIMSMSSYGAVGETNRQMRHALELPENDFLTKLGFRLLVDNLASYKADNLAVANKIYLDYKMRPKLNFMHVVQSVFRSEVESIDMSSAVSASSTINNWCEDNTSHRIKDMVSPDDFKRPVLALLLNAVYFKGTWLTKFDRKYTQKRPFYVNSNEAKQVTSMFVSGEFRYGRLREIASSFVELPYQSEDDKHNVSMFVLLPYRRDGLADLVAKLDTVKVEDLIRASSTVPVDVILPKFRIESKIELVEPLKRMGMEKAFNQPDFSEFADNIQLRIDRVLQKAFIEVDELGSEAAAVTEEEFLDKSGPITFSADHPFVAIIATTSGTPLSLFTARYTGPQ